MLGVALDERFDEGSLADLGHSQTVMKIASEGRWLLHLEARRQQQSMGALPLADGPREEHGVFSL